MEKSKLLLNTLAKFFAGIILVDILLFLPAGTINYFNGWLFIALLFVPMMILGIVLFFKAPDLLAKRLSSKEKEKTQQGVVKFSAWLFLSIPLVLGSWWTLLCFVPYPILIAVKIKNEEKILEEGHPGYTEYKQKVCWKILPFVW